MNNNRVITKLLRDFDHFLITDSLGEGTITLERDGFSVDDDQDAESDEGENSGKNAH